MFHKLIKQKYLCQRVFCWNQSKTDGGGGGGGCQNPKHGESGKEQLKNKGCVGPSFFLTFGTINYPAFPYDVSNIASTVYYPFLSAPVDSRTNSVPPIYRR